MFPPPDKVQFLRSHTGTQNMPVMDLGELLKEVYGEDEEGFTSCKRNGTEGAKSPFQRAHKKHSSLAPSLPNLFVVFTSDLENADFKRVAGIMS